MSQPSNTVISVPDPMVTRSGPALIAPGQVTEDTSSAPFQISWSIALDERGEWIVSTHIEVQCGLPGLLEQEF